MNNSSNLTAPTLISSALLFLLSYLFYDAILKILLPGVNRAIYPSTDAIIEFRSLMIFCFVVALTPLFIVATWLVSPIISANNRFLSMFITILCVLIALFYRYHSIKDYFSMMTQSTGFDIAYPLEETNFAYYILGGLLGGSFISYLIFRGR
ncbi:MAG: hypothetical protein QM737_18180 [Ferruginibacter sp.]